MFLQRAVRLGPGLGHGILTERRALDREEGEVAQANDGEHGAQVRRDEIRLPTGIAPEPPRPKRWRSTPVDPASFAIFPVELTSNVRRTRTTRSIHVFKLLGTVKLCIGVLMTRMSAALQFPHQVFGNPYHAPRLRDGSASEAWEIA